MDPDKNKPVDEEAIAEEEFIADVEDTIENPLVYDGDKLTVQQNAVPDTQKDNKDVLVGAIGTGGLTPDAEPFNNEEALRSESVSNDENPFGADPSSEKAFGGPSVEPLADATETIAPQAPETGDSNQITSDVTDFSTAATETSAGVGDASVATEASEPTIEQLADNTTPADSAAAGAGVADAATAPVDSSTQTSSSVTPAAEPKKKKKGLIIGIVAVLLLAAIIGGVVFFIMHESKDRMFADAISGMWKAEAYQFDGKITMEPVVDEKNSTPAAFQNVVVDFKSDSKGANFSGSGSLTVNISDSSSFSLDLAGAYISGDGIFVKFDKLGDAIKNIDVNAIVGIDADADETSGYFVQILKDTLSAVVEKIDGVWYKINAETFAGNEKMKDSYECLTKSIDKLSSKDVKDKLANIYDAHKFITLEDKDSEKADGLTYLYVKSNEEELKAFSKDAQELAEMKDMKACLDSSSSSGLSIDEGVTGTDDGTTVDIKIGIKGWSHELKSIKGTITSKTGKSNLDIKIGYDKKDVSAPAGDAKNIINAIPEIASAAEEAYKKSYTQAIEKICKENTKTESEYQQCLSMMQESGGGSFDDMIEGIGGSVLKTSALLEDE